METYLGSSPAMTRVVELVKRTANSKHPVMLTGEEGTPKNEIAELIHTLSGRKGFLVTVNLGGIPSGLGASTLLGHARGAFTGAIANQEGLVAKADHGTLLVEQIETASAEVQSALLSLVREGCVTPIGSNVSQPVDVRIVTATSVSSFLNIRMLRQELMYRLNIVSVNVPPLRERAEDIPELAARFLGQLGGPSLSSDDVAVLKSRPYPGNDRELYSILERAVVLSDGQKIEAKDLPPVFSKWESTEEEGAATIRRELAATRAELANLESSSIRATPIWEGRRFKAEDDYCFILMPFAEVRDLQSVYVNHVKKVVEERCKLRCERADDITLAE
jgi:DNA-binding NtrC family response regulator